MRVFVGRAASVVEVTVQAVLRLFPAHRKQADPTLQLLVMGDSAEDTLTQLSSLIEQITQKQGSIALHAQNIKLASSAGLEDEANAARELMTMFLAAPEDVWLPFLAHKEKELGDTMDGVKEVHELYQRAEQDYLCESGSSRGREC